MRVLDGMIIVRSILERPFFHERLLCLEQSLPTLPFTSRFLLPVPVPSHPLRSISPVVWCEHSIV